MGEMADYTLEQLESHSLSYFDNVQYDEVTGAYAAQERMMSEKRYAVQTEPFSYADGPPARYKCGDCGVAGVKLWREYNTFLEGQTLRCQACACKDQKKEHPDPEFPQCDQIGGLIPAVPTEDGDTYWGYTSVPKAGCEWWDRLPVTPGPVQIGWQYTGDMQGPPKPFYRQEVAARGGPMHASAPSGCKCSDCTIDKEACPACYSAWWKKRHPNVEQIGEPEVGGEPNPFTQSADDNTQAAFASLRQRLAAAFEKCHTTDNGVFLSLCMEHMPEILAALDELERLREKSDAEMLRVKACEHIAEGETGWEQLENECPSTMAVGKLRRELETAKARLVELVEAVRGYCGIDGRDGSRAIEAWFFKHRQFLSRWTPELHEAICSEDGDSYSDHPTHHDWYSDREGEMCNKMLAADDKCKRLLPLLEYVQHKPGCDSYFTRYGWKTEAERHPPCNCGLDTLKAACGLPERG